MYAGLGFLSCHDARGKTGGDLYRGSAVVQKAKRSTQFRWLLHEVIRLYNSVALSQGEVSSAYTLRIPNIGINTIEACHQFSTQDCC